MEDDEAARATIGRRELIRLGAGTLVAGAALAACGDRKGAPAATPPPSLPVDASVLASDLEDVSIAELQARMASGRESARSLVDKYRQRIAALDRQGPGLRAVLELNPEADAIADQLDRERAAGTVRGPLHGVPILIKDNVDTGDQMSTTAGSLALEGTRARADAHVVARLRAAGAVILGKANLSEWANFRGRSSTSGWSARGGQCRNPYALDRTPSGSSSGSAVAVAASLCAAAVGTETDGSIVSPASCTSLVGLKPTLGLVSRTGIIPIAASQDTAGPMARTVADAAALMAAMAGADPADATTTSAPATALDYAAHLEPGALRGVRLGVPRAGFFGVSNLLDVVVTAALAELTRLGAVLIDPVDLPIPPTLGAAELLVLATELKAGLDAYLATRGPDVKVRTLADVIAFNQQQAARELGNYGQELFEMAQATRGLTDPAYLEARALCLRVSRAEVLDKVLADHQLDALVSVTGSPPCLLDPINGDSGMVSASMLPAVAGYPHVTVPAGYLRGLPIGLSFYGRPFSDAKLLGYAFAFEQATHHRRPPRFASSAAAG